MFLLDHCSSVWVTSGEPVQCWHWWAPKERYSRSSAQSLRALNLIRLIPCSRKLSKTALAINRNSINFTRRVSQLFDEKIIRRSSDRSHVSLSFGSSVVQIDFPFDFHQLTAFSKVFQASKVCGSRIRLFWILQNSFTWELLWSVVILDSQKPAKWFQT